MNPAGPALADGTFGVAYSQTFTATGGTGPHTFAVTAGAPPGNLTLASSGALTGSPGNTGTFGFTVTATDAFLCTGSRDYALAVRPNAQPEAFSNGVGNTQYVVGAAAPGTPHVFVPGSVLTNDAGPGPLSAGPGSIATTSGGSVAMSTTGAFLRSGNGTPGETSLLCANVGDNSVSAGGGAVADYYLDRLTPASTTFQLQGLSPAPATPAQAEAYIISTDVAPPATAFAQAGTYTAATCTAVSFAPLP